MVVLRAVVEGGGHGVRGIARVLALAAALATPFVAGALAFGLSREFLREAPGRKRWLVSLATAASWLVATLLALAAYRSAAPSREEYAILSVAAAVGGLGLRLSRASRC
jgi:hypothetical protein